MGNTARDLLKYVYLHVRQYGANYAINTKTYMIALQTALNELWANTPGMWNRAHYKDKFVNITPDVDGVYQVVTTHPIDRLDDIYYGTMRSMDGTTDLCDCPEIETASGCNSCCQGACVFGMVNDQSRVKIDIVGAQDHLMPGKAQISGGDIRHMGGHYGRIVSMKLPCEGPCRYDQGLYLTYYRGPQILESFDDIVMVPHQYFTVLAMICAKYLLPIYGMARQNIEMYLDAQIDKQTARLKEKDTVYPTGFNNVAK